MDNRRKHFYEFGAFRVDPAERQLLREGAPIPLPPKAFDTLLVLVENSGHLLTKDELMRLVWRDAFVEENNLTQYVSMLRKALKSDGGARGYIETVPRIGYRFAPCVREVWEEDENPSLNRNERRSVSHEETRFEKTELTNERASAAVDDATPRVQKHAGWRQRPLLFLALAFGACALFVALVLILNGARRRPNGQSLQFIVKSFAVAPLATEDLREDERFLLAALTDDLFVRLARLKHFDARSANSLLYNLSANDALTLARESNAEAVLEESLERKNGRIRISARLRRLRDGATLWTIDAEESESNVLAAQDALIERVAESLAPDLNAEERANLTKRRGGSAEAFADYARGLQLWSSRSAADLHKSVLALEQTVAKDERFAHAYAALACAYAFDYALWTKAEPTARKALELDSSLGEAHAAIGFVRMFWQQRRAEAEAEFKRAAELNPRSATARQWYALCLAAQGRGDAAKVEIEQAHAIDPLSPAINADLGMIYYFTYDVDRAIERCRRTLQMKPDFINAHSCLYEAYSRKGMYDEALEEFFAVRKLSASDITHSVADDKSLRRACADGGIVAFWRELSVQLAGKETDFYALAQYRTRLGDKDGALDALARSYAAHEFAFTLLRADPVFDELRTSARFARLARLQ